MHQQRQMTFGLVGRLTGSEQLPTTDHFAMVEEADDLGYAAFWLNEEHFQRSPRMGTCPVVVGSAIAARTKRMRIGTGVVLLPLHHPLHTAEQFATLDVISGGRVDIGISRGGQQYAKAFGIAPNERFARFEEASEILRQAMTCDTVSFHGEYYEVDGVPMQPRPIQQPPPMYVATYDLETVARYASRGLRALEGGIEPEDAVGRKIHAFNDAWNDSQPTAAPPVPVTRMVYCGEDDTQAIADVEEYAWRAYQTMKRGPTPQGQQRDAQAFQFFRDEIAIIGGPATVRRRLESLHDDHGVRYVNILVHSFWEVPADLIRQSLRRIASEVMPAFNPTQIP